MTKQRRHPWDEQPSQHPREPVAPPPAKQPKPEPAPAPPKEPIVVPTDPSAEQDPPVRADALAPLTTASLQQTAIAPDPNHLGERFMAAFNDIENAVRDASGASHDSFAVLARAYFAKHGLGLHLDALTDFVELRNTLAHGRHFTSGLLATPAPEVVDQVEALRTLVLRPPRALEILARGPVVSCRPDEQLEDALPLIAEHGYSQLPVYDGDTYVGLLTNYAIARWLAEAWQAHEGVASAPISEVLAHGSPAQQAAFVGEAATVADVVARLVGSPAGARSPAVLITTDGTPNTALLAIATGGDLPRLVSALSLS